MFRSQTVRGTTIRSNASPQAARPSWQRCRMWIVPCLIGLAGWSTTSLCRAQGSISNISWTPFVVGITPVVGPGGAVGGVKIDAQGVVNRSTLDDTNGLRERWLGALRPVPRPLNSASPLRKISLRRLSAAIAQEQKQNKRQRLPDEILLLAGLQRIQFVFVYPDEKDIVLAGPAEGWTTGSDGELVGVSTGKPVLHLEDLVEALRTAEAAASGDGISCSIDPTPEGLENYRRASRGGRAPNAATLAKLERAMGPYEVRITGVPATSHFARVMVAADYLMKCLAMNLEKPPIEGLPSYLELLRDAKAAPQQTSPRWWLDANYEPLGTSEDGLAWELRGPGLQILTEEETRDAEGNFQAAKDINPLAQHWAQSMTDRYDALSRKLPVFGQLRNCMDLAVVAALLVEQDLAESAECDLALLMDSKRLAGGTYDAPKTIGAQASFVKAGENWLVSISGGVRLNSWSVLEQTVVAPELEQTHAAAAPPTDDRWWWD